MLLDQLKEASREKVANRLRHRHFVQIHHRSMDHHIDLQSVFAISYRPGNWSGSFAGKRLSVAGCSTVVVLSYESIDQRNRKQMAFRGYAVDPTFRESRW